MIQTSNDRLVTAPPLRKSRPCVITDAVLLALVCFAILIHLRLLSSVSSDVVGVFFRALATSTVVSIASLAVLWFLDRREREAPWLFAGCFLWGGCIATGLVLPFNAAVFQLVDRWVALNPIVFEILGPDATTLIAAPLPAPIAEEMAKAAGVILIFWFLYDEFDNMRDGFVYGALVGVGFNWFEAALYVAQGYVADGVAPYGLQLGARYALLGLGSHALFTGMFGLFFGLAVQTQRMWLKVIAPIVGLSLAVATHMWNNGLPLLAALAAASTGKLLGAQLGAAVEANGRVGFLGAFAAGSIYQLVIFVSFLLIAGIAIWRSGVWERRVIREELASEVGYAVSAEEYRDILADRVLRTRRINDLHPVLSASLVNAQHELAFRKRRVRDKGVIPI